ncbi:FecR family protein [Bacteroides helcogenes]|uniref:Anti-FecI sigma factor, FecR n=1 Tax=Bacteroides helcogenes (strain ATCC 35417 / DSM 20613 / JCM 6297 / CCUG 15421 / P 36-108) TaxID=693979 RepID=E6SSI5_BACT6|nr:FecR family protein [Bacteroides helcogenes]ADV42157.1 anti-FecI sigma factor, FecR [Bacteroides helcogenes P 36-108]MDY5238479.1 FecR family protein [Bacteroides helcogenes]
MKDKKKEESDKYEWLASILDDRSAFSGGETSRPEEELQKLIFLWNDCEPSRMDTDEVWNKTLQKIKEEESRQKFGVKTRLSFNLYAGLVAASIALLLGLFYFFNHGGREIEDEKMKMEQFLLANKTAENVKEVTLVVSDKKKVEIANNAKVAYTQNGQVQVNSAKLDEAVVAEEAEKEEGAGEYNQIIVPKGRRSMIVLADNSRIWINSDSKVIYPRTFKGKKRQIFVEGEVYLKVARDEKKPFVVGTSAFEVEVLGTSFNVAARKGSTHADVVLVEGVVDVKDHQEKHIKMQPNERVELNQAGISKKEKVNALDYIHWVDGVWVLNGKPLKEVLQYLTEYYGQLIVCHPSITDIPFFGKLYLNEELDAVLESIRQTLPLAFASRKDAVYIDSI